MRVSPTAVALLLLGTASLDYAVAPTTSNVFDLQGTIADKNAHLSGNHVIGPASKGGESTAIMSSPLPFNDTDFLPGETIDTAIMISALPFNDTDFTCVYIDDYDESCPYKGSTSPDIVYRYTPGAPVAIDVDLCSSQYDTKVYIYANAAGNLVACNDDAGCGVTGYQSHLTNIPLAAGTNYYIVVDGYFGDCGDYILNMREHQPCGATCFPAHQDEGEPPCGPNYIDSFNGGCNSTPNVFSPAICSHICGRAGTYLFNGSNYRDTDWYRLTVGPGNFSYSGTGVGFTLRLSVLTPICPTSVLSTTSTPGCVPSTPLVFSGPGTFFLFAAPEVFEGVPCESDYYLSITGPGIPGCADATENTSWGHVKGLFR